MAVPLFVKVSPYAAKKLNLDGLRKRMPDGSYLLRQSDMMAFGPLYAIADYARRIGGVVMRDAQAAAEFRGEAFPSPLPVPEDPEWIAPDSTGENDTDTDTGSEGSDETDGGAEDARAPEEPAE